MSCVLETDELRLLALAELVKYRVSLCFIEMLFIVTVSVCSSVRTAKLRNVVLCV